MKKSVIMGIVPIGNDTAAALMIDGKLVAACEEERYTREKHSKLFPKNAIADCLKIGGVTIDQVDEIAIAYDTIDFIREVYLRPALEDKERIDFIIYDIDRIRNSYRMDERIRSVTSFKGPINCYRHHMCHLASGYYPSGFQDALLVSYDGRGEKETTTIALGKCGEIEIVHNSTYFPHSLGLLYSAVTFYLGWKHHCDEGIIMGLASYGDPNAVIPGSSRTYYDVFSEILRETGDYDFIVDQSWMSYFLQRGEWVSEKFREVFGPKREQGDELTQHHKNIAAGLQARLDAVVLNQLRRARKQFDVPRLVMSGGVGLNCSMNGKILASGIFDEIFIPPASGDAGTPMGACYLALQARNQGQPLKPSRVNNFYLGTRFSETDTAQAIADSGLSFTKPANLLELVAKRLEQGEIVGWYQGGSEFGPRALGNRSILCRPFPEEMKDYINARVKFREPFRPFAPAVMREHSEEYFKIKQESPHMLIAADVVPEKRTVIPAVVHVDGTCRVQTVTPDNNLKFYDLLKAFYKITGVPVILNTSFNVKGQPIVNTIQEAIDCYKSTNIDCLIIDDYFVEKDAN
ncbi:MAG: carbamoyltransferase C-terminal domain-containing protein [Desulfuromonadaceae bacterium]|nr:carbamoyltransferase C-terminal domain-containing protein [Desulfuromonadaceae bacterium]MDD5104196.1 carbamoyltransferase C-terminal domain-containing protein [Desulfuromonadaceae bacterium]